jgi:peptidoglycan/LPS O-acetylase OafA/YrhL
MSEPKRFVALDSFRGVCALSVVVFHLHIVGGFTELVFFRNASLFVQMFFVLSGFVLAHTYGAQQGLNFKRFFISRTFRIFPLHLFMLMVFVLLEVGKLVGYKNGILLNKAPFTGVTSPSEFLPNLLLLQAWSGWTEKLSFNGVAWSISVEYYMYMIFGGVLLLFYSFRVWFWLLLSVVSFYMLAVGVNLPTIAVLSGLSCFFAGAVSYIFYVYLKGRVRPSFWGMTLLEVLLLLLVYFALSLDYGNKHIWCSLLFCVLVVVFAFDGGGVSTVLSKNFFLMLGRLSYSIYLTHAAVLFCLVSIFLIMQNLVGGNHAPMIGIDRYIDAGDVVFNNSVGLFCLAIVIQISKFTYKHVEIWGQNVGKSVLARF